MGQGTDYTRVLSYYREFLGHADDARRVAWRAVHDQELRFENLLEALDEALTSFSILDVGCGLGDLLGWLERSGREVQYTGIDIVPEMVEAARARHPQGRFEVCDLLQGAPPPGRFDLVVCSGALTVRVPQHERFVRRMLEAMLAAATGAVAVNFQSTRAFSTNPLARQDQDLYHADPLRLYAVCRELCRWTALREDLLTSDMTVYLYKDHARTLRRYGRLAGEGADPVGLAWLALERRLPQRALELLARAPRDAPSANLRGVAWQQLGDKREARRCYEEALRLDPNCEPARLNLEALGRP
jgi:SAM-dependent methyltransferase